MKQLKRTLCIVTALAMSVSLFMACSKKEDPKTQDKTAGSGKDTKVVWEKAPKVVGVHENNGSIETALGKNGHTLEDNPYNRYIFEKTGVRLEMKLLPSGSTEFKQKLAVELAGGNQIDFITYFNLQQDWMDTGTILPIASFMQKYKQHTANIEKDIPQDAWDGVTKVGSKGEDVIWGFPIRNEFGKPNLRGLYYRKDWLDKLKLEVPKTTDDLTKVMKAFTENDPDGNGQKDTFGLGTSKGFTHANWWMQLFGVDTYREELVGDKLVPYAHTEKAKYAYKTISNWVKSGYVNMEGFTDGKANENKIVNGKIGVMVASFSDIARFYETMHANGIKEAKWSLLDTPLVSSFDNKAYGFTRSDNFANVTMITAQAKESNYESIMKLLNWAYSPEGTDFLEYGFEGKEHKLVNGKKVRDTQYMYADQKTYLSVYEIGKSYNHVWPENFVQNFNVAKDLATQYSNAVATKGDQISWKPTDIKYKYPDLESFKLYPDYRKAIQDSQGKFVLGELDANDPKVWEDYNKQTEKYGFYKLLDEAYKKHYVEFKKK